LSLIQTENPNFKASDGWLDSFLTRHDLSIRRVNSTTPLQETEYLEIAQKFRTSMKEVVSKFKIQDKYIINLDETPFFWEYLPRKVVCSKFSKACSAWKRGYHHQRSTLALAVTASGDVLRPTLILKRTTPYYLQGDNDISLLVLNSKKGWMDENNMVDWIDKVLMPYVQDAEALLIMDSYESHISNKVLSHLKRFTNIHVGIIVGGTTAYCQPLDITVNKEFKSICKKKSLEFTNRVATLLNEINHENRSEVSTRLMILENKFIIAEKDLTRRKKKEKLSQAMLIKKMTVEDIYSWIRAAHLHIKNNPELIIKGFIKGGYLNHQNLEPLVQSNHIHQIEIEEEVNGLFPLSEDEQDGADEDRR